MLEQAPIAAIVYSAGTDPAPVLAQVARTLQRRGVSLAAMIQHSDGPCSMELELLPGGVRIPISQDLGKDAKGCRLNTVAMAEAASFFRAAIDATPALAIFNKFGGQEATGGGLRAEMIAATTAGVPILTAVKEDLLDQWSSFTGGQSVQLPCSLTAALAWWETVAAS